jgi:hypothetical protein
MGAPTPEAAWSGWTPKDVKRRRVAIYKLKDGTFEAFAGIAKIPEGAERLDPQPSLPTSGDPHEGTRVAMKKLESQHPLMIQWGCHVAVVIAKRRMTVHSRDVWEEMLRQKLVEPHSPPPHWMGAVFHHLKNEKILTSTGQTFKYSDASRDNHERKITIWALVENANTGSYDAPPAQKP